VGQKVEVPLYNREVTILADEKVDIEKGSGAVMCCTFGDTTDIEWWGEHNLDLRIILDNRGHMNDTSGFLEGMYWKKARRIIVEKLDEQGYRKGGEDITHAVNVHERCGTPLEYLVNRQWFIKILDMKQQLLDKGSEINWYPSHFKVRYDHWVENLKWDWCISRQRFYGVPFPVWFCSKCGAPVFADEQNLPVDPLVDSPGKPCPICGGTESNPESDVMDTWATSSLTPQINMKWGEEDQRNIVFPMALRPQAHDIIRTWAFYTIAKALLHENSVPWQDVMISGHSLNTDRQKMSKSKGNVAGDPIAALQQFSADELRYWACSSKLGTDVVFSKDVLGEGRRLVTKLWNATRFAEGRLEGYDPARKVELHPFDRWLLSRLTETVQKATAGMQQYEYSVCMREAETFFWKALCDNYLEIAKGRLYGEDPDAGAAAQYTLYTALYGVLRLFAPIMVHITEELYLEIFKPMEKHESIHIAPWPRENFMDEEALMLGNKALLVIEEARRWKSENNLSMATPMDSIEVPEELKPFEADLLSVTRAEKVSYPEGSS
jgi:valyl-tRNA synthetase